MKSAAEFRLIAAAALTVVLISPAHASFEPLPVGGRAAGMGEAYSAIADDVYSLYYNPAGVLQMTRPEIGTYYSQLYPGLTDGSQISRTFLGYAQPIGKNGRQAIGASYLALQLPSLYKEEALGITYGRENDRYWNYGGTLKMLRKSIGTDQYSHNAIDPITGNSTGVADPVLAGGTSKSSFALDVGAQYRLSRAYALGFAARNLNSPNLGLHDSDKVPMILSAAIARHLRTGNVDLEITRWTSATSNMRMALGGEKWFKSGFGLRAGGAFGTNSYEVISLGASYKLDSLQFDYALIYPMGGISGTLGIQQISLSVRLGKAPADPVEQQLLREKEARIKAETDARSAEAETDRLKKQIIALTDERKTSNQERRAVAAQNAVDEAQTAQAKTDRGARRTLLGNYTAAMASYNAKATEGASFSEKRQTLEKIQTDFAGKGLDLSAVNKELKNLRADEIKAKKDYDLSMSFYGRLVQQGATTEERRSMLERIIQKYRDAGIDVHTAEQELKVLK